MSKKAGNVQQKTLEDLQKAWRTIALNHFKKITRKSGSLETKYKNWGAAQDFAQYCILNMKLQSAVKFILIKHK